MVGCINHSAKRNNTGGQMKHIPNFRKTNEIWQDFSKRFGTTKSGKISLKDLARSNFVQSSNNDK
jgi:hypothetical protein